MSLTSAMPPQVELPSETKKPTKKACPPAGSLSHNSTGSEKEQRFFDALLQEVQANKKQESRQTKLEPKIHLAEKAKKTTAALPDLRTVLNKEKNPNKEDKNQEIPQETAFLITPLEFCKTIKKERLPSQALEEPTGHAKSALNQTMMQEALNIEHSAVIKEIKSLKEDVQKTELDHHRRFIVIHRRSGTSEKIKPENEKSTLQPVMTPMEVHHKPIEAKPNSTVEVFFQTIGEKNPIRQEIAQSLPAPSQDAQALRTYLLEKGHFQIVEQARVVLKDQNQGEIRLHLYPENLGKVKVALDWNNHHLVGQIFVENQIVKEVFQQNLEQLLQSFRDGGYQSLSVKVSVGDNHSQQERGTENFRSYENNLVKIENLEEGPIQLTVGSHGEQLINLTI